MLVPIQSWTEDFLRRLQETFPGQVVFAGLQGSYRRGEATEQSDIDMVVVLEQVGLDELRAYRDMLQKMEFGERACGFFCGRQELTRWPRFDLLQLALDTAPLCGCLEDLVSFTAADLEDALHIGASTLYHAAVHSFLYDSDREGALEALEKSLFFLLRLERYWLTGDYPETRQEIQDLFGPSPSDTEQRYQRILRFAAEHL